MSVYLVGETMDKARSHYLAERGKLIQLMRGIYLDADDDIDATVLKHAVRIARYLYPQAYLSAASAVLLAPTRDGRLFLSARRNQRTRIRSLEIVQNTAPSNPSIQDAVVNDGLGDIHVSVSSIRQRFLESFRQRSEHASSIDNDMRAAIAERLTQEHGGPAAAADAIWALARTNEWYREGELAERYLLRKSTGIAVRNLAAFELTVAWHGTPIGHLIHDGLEWRWNALKDDGLPLVRQTTPGKLPPFILSLLPEGWLASILEDKDERAMLRSGKRYMSNVIITDNPGQMDKLPRDQLGATLETWSKDGVFIGQYQGPGRSRIENDFEENLAHIYANESTPRLSGVQIKAPMFLDPSGTLLPGTGLPFTHILKPSGTGGYEALPMVEYASMTFGRACGFAVPRFALVPMPDEMRPALLVERFDIRNSPDDRRLIALEDLCSLLELPVSAKYDGTMEKLARALRAVSTEPEQDLILLLKRQLFAWLIADGDMHLKNLALLKIAGPRARKFKEVRLAPLYDSVTTRVFPRLEKDRLAIKMCGKDDRVQYADFMTCSSTAGIKASDAENAIGEVVNRLSRAVDTFSMPASLNYVNNEERIIAKMLEISRERIESMKKSMGR